MSTWERQMGNRYALPLVIRDLEGIKSNSQVANQRYFSTQCIIML